MLSSLVRGIQCSDKLLGSTGKWSLVHHRKVLRRTWALLRLGEGSGHGEGAPALRPGIACGQIKRNLWIQTGALGAGKSEDGTRVSVQRSQKGGGSLSSAQKGKKLSFKGVADQA